jgi:hypothetical protein
MNDEPSSKEQGKEKTANLNVYFDNQKNLAPMHVNICQVTTSPALFQIDFGYLSPLDLVAASKSPHDLGLIVQNRVTLERDTAQQLRDLLDIALQSVPK